MGNRERRDGRNFQKRLCSTDVETDTRALLLTVTLFTETQSHSSSRGHLTPDSIRTPIIDLRFTCSPHDITKRSAALTQNQTRERSTTALASSSLTLSPRRNSPA